MTTTAERRRLRRRIGSVIGLVLVAFGVGYLLWAHATLTLRLDRSTWWNPLTWSAGPPIDYEPLADDLVGALGYLPRAAGDEEREAVADLWDAWRSVPRPKVFERLAEGDRQIATLSDEDLRSHRKASDALERLVAAGGTELPLPWGAMRTAVLRLEELRETPQASADLCLGLLALAARQLESPRSGLAFSIAEQIAEPCRAAWSEGGTAEHRPALRSLAQDLPTGRLGTCRTWLGLELAQHGWRLDPDQLPELPEGLSVGQPDYAFPAEAEFWWSVQQLRRTHCGLIHEESPAERARVLRASREATHRGTRSRWNRWSLIESPATSGDEHFWSFGLAEDSAARMRELLLDLADRPGPDQEAGP